MCTSSIGSLVELQTGWAINSDDGYITPASMEPLGRLIVVTFAPVMF